MNIWKEDFYIKSYEVDHKNRLRINQLFNFMQEAAGNHAYKLGCGYDDLKSESLIWVLSKVKVELDRYPGWGEKITVETWPKGAFRLYASRDFLFRDEKGEVIGRATTIWLLLDAHSLRPQRVDSLKINYHENASRHALQESLEKIRYRGINETVFERSVSYNDIDVNNHVNNAKYVDWILDCFSYKLFSEKYIKSIQLNYVNAARPDERIAVKMAKDAENSDCYYLEGSNADNDSCIFEAKVELG
jgi:acyl-ACP thioesterase